MKEGDEDWQRSAKATLEGRAIYARGIPTDWTEKQLEDFFNFQGVVESVHLLPRREKHATRAFIVFATHEEAKGAAQVCDNLEVQDSTGNDFRLVCCLKRCAGQKPEQVAGSTELSKARQEGRSLYLSGLPASYQAQAVRALVEQHGYVEEVKLLPAAAHKALSCFAIMATTLEANAAIEGLDGLALEGHRVACTYPRPPKRSAEEQHHARQPPPPPPAKKAKVEIATTLLDIRGFPESSKPADVATAIEAGGRSVAFVEVVDKVAKVRLHSVEDARAVVEELNGFEVVPGCKLAVAPAQEAPAAAPLRRKRGKAVGRLAYNRAQYAAPTNAGGSWVKEEDFKKSAAAPSSRGQVSPYLKGGWGAAKPELDEEV